MKFKFMGINWNLKEPLGFIWVMWLFLSWILPLAMMKEIGTDIGWSGEVWVFAFINLLVSMATLEGISNAFSGKSKEIEEG